MPISDSIFGKSHAIHQGALPYQSMSEGLPVALSPYSQAAAPTKQSIQPTLPARLKLAARLVAGSPIFNITASSGTDLAHKPVPAPKVPSSANEVLGAARRLERP